MSSINASNGAHTPYQEYLDRRGLTAVPVNVALAAARTLLESGSPVKPMLMGGAGVGKTEGFSQMSKSMESYLVILMGGFASAEQERGVPVINENEDGSISFSPAARDLVAEPLAELKASGKIVRGDKEYSSMFILFDELNQADNEVLKIFFSAFSSDSLPGLDWSGLPVYVAATGNPPIGGYKVKKIHLSDAWDRRLCIIPVQDSTFSVWSRWAKPAGVCQEVLSYLKANQTQLQPSRTKEEKVPTPATWAAVSELIKGGIDFKSRSTAAVLDGMLGHLTGLAFRQWCLEGAQDSLSSEEILNLPWAQVQEYLKGIIKEGKLAQLANNIRNLAEHVVNKNPGVAGVGSRVALVVIECPRDTRSVWSHTVDSEISEMSPLRQKEVRGYLNELHKSIQDGPVGGEWREAFAGAAQLSMK